MLAQKRAISSSIFGPVVGHKFQIVGGLVVLPDVVGNGRINMALVVGDIGNPPARAGVEVQYLAFFATVAAALPGEHGPPVARLQKPGSGLHPAADSDTSAATGTTPASAE